MLSGQMVNLDKCEVSFSNCLIHDVRRRVSSVLGFKEVLSHEKYLGLPTLFKRSMQISFTGIKDRIWKKLQMWKEKLLSKDGKEVLIKAVAQSIPTYAMSCFRLPTSFVTMWKKSYVTSGGAPQTQHEESLGKRGKICVGLKARVDWGSET